MVDFISSGGPLIDTDAARTTADNFAIREAARHQTAEERMESIEVLLNIMPVINRHPTLENASTPLMFYAHVGHVEEVHQLLENLTPQQRQIEIMRSNNGGNTALNFAKRNNYKDIIQALLEHLIDSLSFEEQLTRLSHASLAMNEQELPDNVSTNWPLPNQLPTTISDAAGQIFASEIKKLTHNWQKRFSSDLIPVLPYDIFNEYVSSCLSPSDLVNLLNTTHLSTQGWELEDIEEAKYELPIIRDRAEHYFPAVVPFLDKAISIAMAECESVTYVINSANQTLLMSAERVDRNSNSKYKRSLQTSNSTNPKRQKTM